MTKPEILELLGKLPDSIEKQALIGKVNAGELTQEVINEVDKFLENTKESLYIKKNTLEEVRNNLEEEIAEEEALEDILDEELEKVVEGPIEEGITPSAETRETANLDTTSQSSLPQSEQVPVDSASQPIGTTPDFQSSNPPLDAPISTEVPAAAPEISQSNEGHRSQVTPLRLGSEGQAGESGAAQSAGSQPADPVVSAPPPALEASVEPQTTNSNFSAELDQVREQIASTPDMPPPPDTADVPAESPAPNQAANIPVNQSKPPQADTDNPADSSVLPTV